MLVRIKEFSVACCLGLFVSGPVVSKELSEFVTSNAIHTLFHEIAHGIIDQFQLPVIGQEEDAADAFATLEVINMLEDDAKQILVDVAASWLHMDAKTDREDLDFYDIHDLDAQRAYRTICHLYSVDPDGYADVADWADLPEDTLDVCLETGPLAFDSWETLLSDILLADGAPETPITVTYAESPEYEALRKALQEDGLLDDMAHYAQVNFSWPEPINFVAEACGEANAFWDPQSRTVTLCYEILEDWAQIERELDGN